MSNLADNIEFKIVKKAAFKVVGSSKLIKCGEGYTECPKFWTDHYAKGNGKYVSGMYGICIDDKSLEGSFKYMIADDYIPQKEMPSEFETMEVSENTWAVFPCKGPIPQALQKVNSQIFSKWLPQNKEYELAGMYNIEYYTNLSDYPKGNQDENYYCEIWIPVKEKILGKQEIYECLTEKEIEYEITEHKAVFSMNELGSVTLPYPEWDAKNLFVRDDKKQNYYLITVRGNKRADLKSFSKSFGLRRLSFASSEELFSIMKLLPGSVSPFGILNDEEKRVHFFLDSEYLGNKIGIHPNDNTATVWLKSADLMKLIQEHGNKAEFVEI